MIIKQTRIRNLALHLPGISPGNTLVFALKDLPSHQARLQIAGFPPPFKDGMAVLPTVIGPVSRFNAEGTFIVHRDLPKEKVYRQRLWTHKEWHGPDQVEKTDLVYVPYQRYPRTPVPPPGVEFKLGTDPGGSMVLVTDPITYQPDNAAKCLHSINLLLEYFGECHVLDQTLASILRVEVRRLNWQVLPPGVRPWPQMQSLLEERIPKFDTDKHNVFRNNLAFLNKFKPSFAAVGRAGFSGYVIFGFPDKDDFVCESVYKNNATYVFAADWEKLSSLTKAEILTQSLQKDRIIHNPGWHARVNKLLL